MKNLLFYCCAFLLSFAACKQTQSTDNQQPKAPSKKEMQQEIAALEERLVKALDANKDKEAAMEVIVKSKAYYDAFPEDKNTARYLFKAADVARGIKEYGKAIQYWGLVWRNYPDYERAADALFLQGFTFENDLKDKNQAAAYYRQFLEKFPNHKLAEQVILSVNQLTMTPEELIKSFENKEGQ